MRLVPIILGVAMLAPTAALAQQKTRMRGLQDLFAVARGLRGSSGPQNIVWIEGGRRFSFTQRADSGGTEIRAMDPATGTDTLLFTTRGVTFPGTTEPFTYRTFQWAHDSRHLVFQTHFKPLYRRSGTADFYVYSLAGHSMQLAASGARTAELSPDGAMLGYERDGDLYVYDMARHQEKRLTSDATPTAYNGHFDWMYEEEFGIAQGWNWSPDSRHLAYWRVDESAEPEIQLTNYAGAHPTWEKIRIPQPGDSITKVRIGVIDVQSGHRVWLDTGERGDFYIPRIYWTSEPDTLAVLTLNRPQNLLKVFFFDVRSGGRRLVFTDSSRTWIDVFDFYAGIPDMMTFPAGLKEFFWISDRDGWQHVYRYAYSGRLLDQVTHGAWSVTRVEGIDTATRTLYYSSTEISPLQRQLYAIGFDGTHQRRLTATAGTHSIDMSPDAHYYIDRWSALDQPQQVELWTTADGGRKLRTMVDNASVTEWLKTHAYAPTRIFSFTTSDGQVLDGSMVKPLDFDSTRRYPVIFSVYGGPGSQQVYDRFATSPFAQWYAQEGYIVVGLNNRGSNNYGSAFEKVVYKHLGHWESHDFAEEARYLETLPYVDTTHIAIMGTSYGGYSTLYTMAMYPHLFTVGIANSPGTSWRLYDAIYTERYMGLLADNAAGYDSSAVMPFADSLKNDHLLLIHSMMDDNVHPVNTMQLLTALTNAGVDASLRIYPPGRHGAAYNLESFMLIQKVSNEFLNRWMH